MPQTFDEGDRTITVTSEETKTGDSPHWRATATACIRATGVVVAEVSTQALHGSAAEAEDRALVMLRWRLAGNEVD